MFAHHQRTLSWAWIVAFVILAPCSQAAFGQLPGANWQYHWGDDFSGNTLDSTKWSYNYPWGTNHNHDATMSPDNVTLGDGTLTLTAERTGPGGDFQSGAISSGYNRFTFNGGYVEASIRLPDTPGSWPAFWGLFDGWPPEADIMEYPIGTAAGGGYNQDQYHTAWHYSTGSGNAAGGGQVNPAGVGDLGGTYHNFGMQWIEDDWVGFYFNGQLVREFGNDAAIAQMERMYLILNYAVGGWPGRPDLNEWAIGHTDEMKVDFVRIWKQANAFSTNWNYSGTSEYVQWDDPLNWTGNVPDLGGATINFDTRTGLAEQRIDWAGRRTATILNFAGDTRYRLGWPDDRLVLGYGNSGNMRATINVDANTTVNHEIFSHLEIAGGLTINNDSNQAFLLTGHISGDGGIFINGPGAVHFSGNNNTYAGPTIIDSGGQGPGIAVARGQNSFGSGGILIGQQGNGTTGRLELENNSLVSNQITLNGRNNNSAGIQNNSGSNTIAGSVGIHVGGGSYIIDAAGGTLNLSGTANGGLAIHSFASGDRTLTLQGTAAGIVSGRIENGAANLNLVKAGAGTWTLQNNNSYTGTTTVLAGELTVNGTHSGGGDYFIGENGRLAGTGVIAPGAGSTITIAGQLGPGNSIGELTVGSLENPTTVSFADAGELWIEVGAAGESDLLAILGTLDLSGANDVLHLQSLGGAFDGSSYLIATFAPGTLNEQRFDQILLDGANVGSSELLGNGYRVDYDKGLGRLTLVAVPEPAGGMLLLVGGTICLLRRRK